jgi:hypothetical protein
MTLQLEAYTLSGDDRFLAQARTVADWALADLAHDGLIMGASNMQYMLGNRYDGVDRPGYYFSGTGTPSLVRGLFRLGELTAGRDDPLGSDPHVR